jgi:hypothetical protein
VTEEEWYSTTDPQALFNVLFARSGHARKRRLLLCGCCRVLYPQLVVRRADWLELAERYADGLATDEERKQVNPGAFTRSPWSNSAGYMVLYWATLRDASHANVRNALIAIGQGNLTHRALVCDLIRDIFGNPFRPVAFDPSWRTSTAVALARQMYESRDFSAMPILADALEEAGCDSPDVLAHCRGDGPHVRGCWVVDLVLGKA